ncbi:hypothetical protein GJ744_011640 [Endocarpon pusillum]|uniref:Uncharacterized protein n=1 Tax=Endocarpon pusillum TaxID=364733 RepID=A0A8H7AD19_9EURO|nr:hypothetical protein GJ744_011640 [Endocarpon pusillum]
MPTDNVGIDPFVLRHTAPNSETFSENLHYQTELRDARTCHNSRMRLKREPEGDLCVPDLEKVRYWDPFDEDPSDECSSDGDFTDEDSADSSDSSDWDYSEGNSSNEDFSDEDSSSEADFSEADCDTNIYHMRCGDDHHQNVLEQLRQSVEGQNANHCRGKQHAVENNGPTTKESRSSSYLHLDQATFDIIEICCELVMDLSSMIDL